MPILAQTLPNEVFVCLSTIEFITWLHVENQVIYDCLLLAGERELSLGHEVVRNHTDGPNIDFLIVLKLVLFDRQNQLRCHVETRANLNVPSLVVLVDKHSVAKVADANDRCAILKLLLTNYILRL